MRTMRARPSVWARAAPIVLSALVLAGCAKFYWTRADTTPAQFVVDDHACARQAVGASETIGPAIHRACLKAAGYARDKYYLTPPDDFGARPMSESAERAAADSPRARQSRAALSRFSPGSTSSGSSG